MPLVEKEYIWKKMPMEGVSKFKMRRLENQAVLQIFGFGESLLQKVELHLGRGQFAQ